MQSRFVARKILREKPTLPRIFAALPERSLQPRPTVAGLRKRFCASTYYRYFGWLKFVWHFRQMSVFTKHVLLISREERRRGKGLY
jgi:hypothetical protein